jgi:DNA-binding beta-propeller fold protein YncE
MTFASQPRLDVVDLSDPAHPVFAFSIDLTPWGADAHATSVAVHRGIVAVAVPQGVDDTAPGKALFFDADGQLLNQVTVGALPDMLTFTPDGKMVLTANEGQPTDDYSFDPEGSVSIISLYRGVRRLRDSDVTTAGFAAFNDRRLDPSIRIYGPGATVAQDLEPEYIAISRDSETAWVTLQENNALAVVDLKRKKVTKLVGLGFKNHSRAGRGLDGGRDDGANAIRTWPVRGMYQPDAIASFKHKDDTYLVTANEGDVREYSGLNDAGAESVEIEDITLDPTAFPDAATIQSRPLGIGRLKVTSFDGDTDGDGDYDELYSFGARSFSIWSDRGRLLFDSGDMLEQLTAAVFPANFNASNANNTRDDRSDDKGPEPEGVTVARISGRTYLFVMLERIGGVVVFELDDPRRPDFVQYINTRNFAAAPGTEASEDQGAEAARFVPADSSPNGEPLLIVSNEVSGTLRIYQINRK